MRIEVVTKVRLVHVADEIHLEITTETFEFPGVLQVGRREELRRVTGLPEGTEIDPSP